MQTNYERVAEFHRAFNIAAPPIPVLPSLDRWELRLRLIDEEYEEVQEAYLAGDLVEVAHELADLLFVVYGAALECGIPIDDCFRAVAVANLTKVDDEGRPFEHIGSDKIPKGPNYQPPRLAPLLGLT